MNETTIINATTKSLVIVNEIATTIVVGIIIFLIGLILARIASKLTQRLLRDFSLDNVLKKQIGMKTSFEKFISSGVFFIVMMTFLVIALNYIGVTSLIVNILSIAIIIVVIISLLLAIKENVPNIIAYRTILQKNLIEEGDEIVIDSAKGRVEEISLFQIQICQGNDIIYIPNSLFLKKEFTREKRKSKKKAQKKTITKKQKNTQKKENKNKKTTNAKKESSAKK